MELTTKSRRIATLALAAGAVAVLALTVSAMGAAASTTGATQTGAAAAAANAVADNGSTTVAMRQAAGHTQQEIACNCVFYVQSRTGLPGGPATAAGYTESKMRSFCYHKVNPTAGAILVWDANQKGAYGAGHIAIIRSASYNTKTKKWTITVDHANWGGCGIRSTSFSWGDLYGVNAYVR